MKVTCECGATGPVPQVPATLRARRALVQAAAVADLDAILVPAEPFDHARTAQCAGPWLRVATPELFVGLRGAARGRLSAALPSKGRYFSAGLSDAESNTLRVFTYFADDVDYPALGWTVMSKAARGPRWQFQTRDSAPPHAHRVLAFAHQHGPAGLDLLTEMIRTAPHTPMLAAFATIADALA